MTLSPLIGKVTFRRLLYVYVFFFVTVGILYSLHLSVFSTRHISVTTNESPMFLPSPKDGSIRKSYFSNTRRSTAFRLRPLPAAQETSSMKPSVVNTRRSPLSLSRPLPATQESNPKNPYLDVVCVFPLMDTVEWSKARYSHVNGTNLVNREKEYIDSLKRNLNHTAVSSVHLFSHRPEQLYRKLAVQYGVNMSKVIFYNSTENPTYQEMFGYVSRFLQGRFVMILNADNYMGDGFVDLDLDYLRKNKVMYSLTRRFPVPMPTGCGITEFSHCEQKSIYTGSHDSFLFFVRSELPENFLTELNFPSHVYGSENVVIWAFQHILKFSVLNPCKKVHIHHLHCTNIRANERIRVNGNGESGQAPFTDNFYDPKIPVMPSH